MVDYDIDKVIENCHKENIEKLENTNLKPRKICPIKIRECNEIDCGWWDKNNNRCVAVSVSENISNIGKLISHR